jgi:hypothetical protein
VLIDPGKGLDREPTRSEHGASRVRSVLIVEQHFSLHFLQHGF